MTCQSTQRTAPAHYRVADEPPSGGGAGAAAGRRLRGPPDRRPAGRDATASLPGDGARRPTRGGAAAGARPAATRAADRVRRDCGCSQHSNIPRARGRAGEAEVRCTARAGSRASTWPRCSRTGGGLEAGHVLAIAGQVAAGSTRPTRAASCTARLKPACVLLEGDRVYVCGLRRRGLARERRLHRAGAARAQRRAAERALGRLRARLRDVRGLHGAAAVPAGDALDTQSAHLRAPLPSIRELRPELPAALDDAVAWALAKDPRACGRASAGALVGAARGACVSVARQLQHAGEDLRSQLAGGRAEAEQVGEPEAVGGQAGDGDLDGVVALRRQPALPALVALARRGERRPARRSARRAGRTRSRALPRPSRWCPRRGRSRGRTSRARRPRRSRSRARTPRASRRPSPRAAPAWSGSGRAGRPWRRRPRRRRPRASAPGRRRAARPPRRRRAGGRACPRGPWAAGTSERRRG